MRHIVYNLFLCSFLLLASSKMNAQSFTFFATHTAGLGRANIEVTVIEPAATTGDSYRVVFDVVDGQNVYSVENVTTGSVALTDVPAEMTSPIFDGLQVALSFLPSRIIDIEEVQYGDTAVDPAIDVFRPGDAEGEGGLNSTGEYTFVGGGGSGGFSRISGNQAATNLYDYEMRFDGNPGNRNKLFFGFTGEPAIDVPFSLWNIGRGTPNDTTDDRQIVAVGFDDSGNPSAYDGGVPASDGGAGTMFDRVYFMDIDFDATDAGDIDGDGDVDYDDVLQDLQNQGGLPGILSAPYIRATVISRFCMVHIQQDPNFMPPVGTSIRITTEDPPTLGDVYEFSAPQFNLYTAQPQLDFGNVQRNNPATIALTIGNRSSAPIAVSDITSSRSEFAVSTTSLTIEPGNTVEVDIIFTPTQIARVEGELTILSNDILFPQYRISLVGIGAGNFISQLSRINLPAGSLTDVWGYVDSEGVEYAVVGGSGVSIVRVDDPANPEVVSHIAQVPGFDVKVWGDYVYSVTGGGGNGGGIVDISDPANPQIVGQFPSSHNIFIAESGHIISESPGLRVFDLNPDPTNPTQIFTGGSEGHDASVIGNILYDFHGRAGTFIYDFTNPASPALLSSIINPAIAYNHSGWTSEDGNYLFICDELSNHPSPDISVYDISDINNPEFAGSWADPDATVHNLFVIDDFAFVSYYTAGFRVFDVSDPRNLDLVDEFDTSPATGRGFAGAFGVYPFAPSGNIYISDGGTGLHIFSFNDPTTSVDSNDDLTPGKFALFPNYPNPFNPETVIKYEIGVKSHVKIDVFNLVGQRVRTLVDQDRLPGTYQTRWQGINDFGQPVSSGIYFYRIKTDEFVQTRRMLLVR